MDTIDELISFCHEQQPVGALMLTGEWGCGKTYLIDNIFKEKISNSFILLRISLFGINSVQALKDKVRDEWFNIWLEDAGNNFSDSSNKLVKLMGRAMVKADKFIENVPDGAKNEIIQTIMPFNLKEFISVKNTIGDKKVLLIFDDLERSRIDHVDLIGCINEYTENLRFHTIIVTNEDVFKLNSKYPAKKNTNNKNDEDVMNETHNTISTLNYDEIKEKAVERTIKYKPDYPSIIKKILFDYCNQDNLPNEYIALIKCNENDIIELFSIGTDIKSEYLQEDEIKRPHNFRLLKCSLVDFERVYRMLYAYGVDELNKWLLSFIAFFMCAKSGVKLEGEYGTLFGAEKISIVYPGYYSGAYMLKSIENWILHGVWNEEIVANDIQYWQYKNRASTPLEKMRTYDLIEMDELDITAGFPEIIKLAYEGKLELDEYVRLICDVYHARQYNYELPQVIDYALFKNGINICIDSMLKKRQEPKHSQINIGDINALFPDKEDEGIVEAYNVIHYFRENKVLAISNNEKLYLDSIKDDFSAVVTACKGKRFNSFTAEMAEATAEAFLAANNYIKYNFLDSFKDIWQPNIQLAKHEGNIFVGAWDLLIDKLKVGEDIYIADNKTIAAKHTENFIKVVEELRSITV